MARVSIIIPVLNGAETVGRAVASVQRQTVRDIEIIVVDDGSTDGTFGVVARLAAADRRVKCIRLPENRGVSRARNAALAAASGEWITLLDADDWYDPTRLDVLLRAAAEYDADVVADNLKLCDHVNGAIVGRTRFGLGRRPTLLTPELFFDGDNPLRRHPMGYLQPLVRRQFLADHRIAYDPSYRVGEDFLFLAELLLLGARAVVVPAAHYIYVHCISPTTRSFSPTSHSRVEGVFDMFIRGCDKLMRKYGASMSGRARRALERRRRIHEKGKHYGAMRSAVRERRFAEAAGIAIREPVTLVWGANIVAGMLYANAQFYLRPRTAHH